MDRPWLPGHARVSFHSSATPINLSPKDPDAKPVSLLSLCKEITPPCRLNPLLFNGHLQTFWTAVNSFDVPVYYKRHIFTAEDPAFAGTFAVDFAVKSYDGGDETLPPRTTYYPSQVVEDLRSLDDSPMLVTLHGLSGGSHEIYLRRILQPLLEFGWEACVVNSRGCAMSKITTGLLYNGRATWDIRQIVKWLKKRFPNRPLFGLGFSLGANILANVCSISRSRFTLRHDYGLTGVAVYVVSWRRRRQMHAQGSCRVLKSMELGSELTRIAKNMAWT